MLVCLRTARRCKKEKPSKPSSTRQMHVSCYRTTWATDFVKFQKVQKTCLPITRRYRRDTNNFYIFGYQLHLLKGPCAGSCNQFSFQRNFSVLRVYLTNYYSEAYCDKRKRKTITFI
jgi:hypothetical protein